MTVMPEKSWVYKTHIVDTEFQGKIYNSYHVQTTDTIFSSEVLMVVLYLQIVTMTDITTVEEHKQHKPVRVP